MKLILSLIFFNIALVLATPTYEGPVKAEPIARLNKVPKQFRPYITGLLFAAIQVTEEFEKTCPGTIKNFNASLTSFEDCYGQNSDSLTLCEVFPSRIVTCSQPISRVFDECVPESSRGLLGLFVNSTAAAAEFLCRQNGESIFELFNPCIWEGKLDAQGEDKFEECQTKATKPLMKYARNDRVRADNLPSPAQVCEAVGDLAVCWKVLLEASCTNQKTKAALWGLKTAAFGPCSAIINKTT